MSAAGGLAEQFTIQVGDSVSPGAPGAGAGVIAAGANTDTYTFQGVQGQAVFFEEVSVSSAFAGWLIWDLKSPGNTTVFSEYFPGSSPGRFVLPETGTYTLRVRVGTDNPAYVGNYSFRLREIPNQAPIRITMDTIVTTNQPQPGAGYLEVPGALDDYVFHGDQGQLVYFEEVNAASAFEGYLRFEVKAPSGTRLFLDYVGGPQTGRRALPETGDYQMLVYSGRADIRDVGGYALRLRAIPPDPTYPIAIGQTVSFNQPSAGAGQIDIPGAQDFYTFQGQAGQNVYFEQLSADASLQGWLAWECKSPSGANVFSSAYFGTSVVGRKVLPESGTYRIRCYVGSNDPQHLGKYSFQLKAIDDSSYALQLGTIVANGTPAAGAGRIEAAGSQDLYTFSGNAGQRVVFKQLAVDSAFGGWLKMEVRSSAGEMVLNTYFPGRQTNIVRLPATGQYNVKVYAGIVGNYLGDYSFQAYSDVYAIPDRLWASPAQALEVPLSVLMCNDQSEGGDVLAVDFLSLGTGQGGTLATNGTTVRYTSPAAFNGTDTFIYRLRGKFGGESFGQVTVRVAPGAAQEAAMLGAFRTTQDQVRVCLFGMPNQIYKVQQSTNLTQWTQGGTVTMEPNGAGLFHYNTGPGRQYYRFAR